MKANIPADAQKHFDHIYYKLVKKGTRIVPFVWLNGKWIRTTTDPHTIVLYTINQMLNIGEIKKQKKATYLITYDDN